MVRRHDPFRSYIASSEASRCTFRFWNWGERQVIDTRHVTEYACVVIKTFADRDTQELYSTGKSKRFPPDIVKRAVRKLEYIDLAARLDDLKVPPGNRLHELKGERTEQHSISVNDQWRICFRFVDGDAYDVEVTDYHE
jgi:proteic killer suppression protein